MAKVQPDTSRYLSYSRREAGFQETGDFSDYRDEKMTDRREEWPWIPPRALRLSLIVHRRKVECRMAKLWSNGRIVAVSLTIFFADFATRADNWPAWRGPHGSGNSAESSVPIYWSTNQNVAWKAPLPDRGNSTPIVWEQRVFL